MASICVELRSGKGRIEGHCDARFEEVLTVFLRNFEEREEVGASLSIFVMGQRVVDLWGGKIAENSELWRSDSVSIVYSCTKGATALCAHMLADRGLLDLHAPIASYWPEFASKGKGSALVAMALDHSLGLPHVYQAVKAGGYYDYDYMVDLIAAEEPFWEPGSRSGYHAYTFGWIVGEIVRRVSGKRLRDFFREEVATPQGLDFSIGAPRGDLQRIVPLTRSPPNPSSRYMQAGVSEALTPAKLIATNNGGFDINSRECLAAEIAGANGVTNARGLARMYDAMFNGALLSKDALSRLGRVSSATQKDATLQVPSRFALGYMKSMDNTHVGSGADASLIMSDAAFGHAGAGGSVGFADPLARFSFGYTMNHLGSDVLMNARGQDLIDATYRALGYRSRASGCWTT
jgi:CubicO group peptidase (beta-lactamase class C family)